MSLVTIVDYGMGNLSSVANAFNYLGAETRRVSTAEEIQTADILVLPGVGAFSHAMERLRISGMERALKRHILQDRRPFLGICLGMQLIAEDSDEYGNHEGLGIIKGHVRRLSVPAGTCLPHVGWNVVRWNADVTRGNGFLQGDAHFYFDHSYVIEETDADILATADCGTSFTAAVVKDNVTAVQFHPEKSQNNGLRVLRGFLNSAKEWRAC